MAILLSLVVKPYEFQNVGDMKSGRVWPAGMYTYVPNVTCVLGTVPIRPSRQILFITTTRPMVDKLDSGSHLPKSTH